jgi:hypothetical protein
MDRAAVPVARLVRQHLPAHQVSTAFELDWGQIKNGELLAQAGARGFSSQSRPGSTSKLKFPERTDCVALIAAN